MLIAGLAALLLSAPTPRVTAPAPFFEEIPPAKSGIHWRHDNAFSPQRYLPETMGPGVAFVDYDNDGWMDIFLVNSGLCDFYRPSAKPRNGLYRNNRNGTFTEVTGPAGVAGGDSFGMGVAVGDYDNDGYPDLFVTAYGRCILYRNNRNGTFTDVTAEAGVATPGWTTSAVWFDYDGDGRLDLFVCSFVQYTRESQKLCVQARGGLSPLLRAANVPPDGILPLQEQRGRDVPGRQPGNQACRPGWARRWARWPLTSTTTAAWTCSSPTTRWRISCLPTAAQGWEDIAFGALVAVSSDGWPRSGMGVDSADIDGDGWQDLFVSNLDKEMFALYRNTGLRLLRRSVVRGRDRQGDLLSERLGTEVLRFR